MSVNKFTEFSKEWIEQSKGYEHWISIAIGQSLEVYYLMKKTHQYATLKDVDVEFHGSHYMIIMSFNDTSIKGTFFIQGRKLVASVLLYYKLYISNFICSSHYDFIDELDENEEKFVDNIGKIHPHFYPPRNINAEIPHEFDIIIDPSDKDCNINLRDGKCMSFIGKDLSKMIQSIKKILEILNITDNNGNKIIPKIAIISNLECHAYYIKKELNLNATFIYLTMSDSKLRSWLDVNEKNNKIEYYTDELIIIDKMSTMSITDN